MKRALLWAALISSAASLPAAADLKQAMAESDLEKRSALALDNAHVALKAAREAYQKGENDRMAAAIDEVERSVDLAYDSLTQTGKDPAGVPDGSNTPKSKPAIWSAGWRRPNRR